MMTPLKRERLRRNLAAEALANAVGVRRPTIARIENGTKRPSPELAKRIADFFGGKLTRDQILFPEEYPATRQKKAA